MFDYLILLYKYVDLLRGEVVLISLNFSLSVVDLCQVDVSKI